jgi:hypothetical protein
MSGSTFARVDSPYADCCKTMEAAAAADSTVAEMTTRVARPYWELIARLVADKQDLRKQLLEATRRISGASRDNCSPPTYRQWETLTPETRAAYIADDMGLGPEHRAKIAARIHATYAERRKELLAGAVP